MSALSKEGFHCLGWFSWNINPSDFLFDLDLWRWEFRRTNKKAPNQRGYGKSSKPAAGLYHINFLVADIASFVKQKGTLFFVYSLVNVHLANNTKVILVIHDWGSAVGFEFTRQHPELVEKIVGINSPSLPGMRIQWKTNPVQLVSRKDI